MDDDRAGFVTAILADPDDSTARLVMADWFGDRGRDCADTAAVLRQPGWWAIRPRPWRLAWRTEDTGWEVVVGYVPHRTRPRCQYREAVPFCSDGPGIWRGRTILRHEGGGVWVCDPCMEWHGAGDDGGGWSVVDETGVRA